MTTLVRASDLGAGAYASQADLDSVRAAEPRTVSGAVTLSLVSPDTGGVQQLLTLSGNITALTLPQPTPGRRLELMLRQDATGGRTVAWPASVKWPAGAAPVLTATASRLDWVELRAIDNSQWLGRVIGQNYSA